MLLNNHFSKKNNYLYKMKCINTRNSEYYEDNIYNHDRIEKNNFLKGKR
ncbi:MAG: hypothetical protein IJK67_00125 [Bacilli bacterium]|nr:hypothetical protein [Bacilli bacterium]